MVTPAAAAALVAGQQRGKLRPGPVGELSTADHQLATSTSAKGSGPAEATKRHRARHALVPYWMAPASATGQGVVWSP